MTVYQSGPFNLEQGNSVAFAVEFLDASGNLTIPSTANMTVSYITTSNVSVSESVTLTQNNSFFVGTWSSTSARLGLATWQATTSDSTSIMSTGQIRVLQRQSTL